MDADKGCCPNCGSDNVTFIELLERDEEGRRESLSPGFECLECGWLWEFLEAQE